MSGVRLIYTAGEVVLQGGHQSVQRPLAVDRHNLLPDLQHRMHSEAWVAHTRCGSCGARPHRLSFPFPLDCKWPVALNSLKEKVLLFVSKNVVAGLRLGQI